jgi:Ca2+-binding RTX toxin-like protein
MSQVFEGLEDRRLLSSTLTGGVLTITGTPNADRVLVTSAQDKVYVAESTVTPGEDGARPTITTTRKSFNRAEVHSIEAFLGAGNDQMVVSDFSFFRTAGEPIPATLNGEAGNDYLVTGRGDDTLNGGDGNDLLSGDGGKAHINGGAGDDVILGGGGDDTLTGDSGNDFLAGAAGNDTVNGDDGRDRLDGGRGDDVLNGGNGNDAIFAVDFSGTDKIDGGAHDADTKGDVAVVDQGDEVTNVEHVRTIRARQTRASRG